MSSYNIVVFGGALFSFLRVLFEIELTSIATGDHCGPEVTAEAVKASIDATGSPLTDEALNAAKSADAVILGAIGGPKWGTGAVSSGTRHSQAAKRDGHIRKPSTVLLRLREPSRLISSDKLKYAKDDGSGFAMDTEPYSRMEIERVTRLAAHLALAENPPAPVWSLDKANVMATSRLWRKTVTEVMEKEFPQLKLGHHLIDSAAMLMVKNPRALNGIIVTSNLFGDIISDEASVIPGSLGLLPSASLTASPDGKSKCNGIYEPIHGSAPDISGKGIVNPVATLLSVSMMLKYSLQQPELAKKVDEAVRNVIEKGIRTADIGGSAKTAEVGDAVAKELETLLKK
ncbi:hypothetical protein MRB53_041123 [Persea americana]|nr:hypothetical protein MRB53_041123 [Persea americana]